MSMYLLCGYPAVKSSSRISAKFNGAADAALRLRNSISFG